MIFIRSTDSPEIQMLKEFFESLVKTNFFTKTSS